jgi:RNA polymerase sigma-70 factor (ECF subfamily)
MIRMPDTVSEAQVIAIYRATVDSLYGFVSRRVGGERQLAEDITQETWLRAVREWRRTGVPENPPGWLTTVARNLILNHVRRHEPIALDTLSSADVLRAVAHDETGDSAEVAALMSGALQRMPPHEALLLEQFHYERCKVAQLAECYGISERAVEGRLRRARERLRQELGITRPKLEGGTG